MAIIFGFGYDREGYDKNGYNREGYNRAGYDRDGYNINGFNANGFDRRGYDCDGYDKSGFNREGYDRDGYDYAGFDVEGYDRNGYDREGYNRTGYNARGYNRAGYDKSGYDSLGYDRDGFDKKGYTAAGYDREGFDRHGYDLEGYDREGYDKAGFDRKRFNKDGYDSAGFNREGYSKDGYDQHGYDKFGYNKNGYDKQGYDIKGYNKDGLDKDGYDRNGYRLISPSRWVHGQSQSQPLASVFKKYDIIVVFTVETTGFDPRKDQIVELAAEELRIAEGQLKGKTHRWLVQLYGGRSVTEEITRINHITNDLLRKQGIDIDDVIHDFTEMWRNSRTLLVAHNANFHLAFVNEALRKCKRDGGLQKFDFLDSLTVFKDRHPYPHKLGDAISAYRLESAVKEPHSATDDTNALSQVLVEMAAEKEDLIQYVNLFGFNPKYPPKYLLNDVKYISQPYDVKETVYQQAYAQAEKRRLQQELSAAQEKTIANGMKKKATVSEKVVHQNEIKPSLLIICPDCTGKVSRHATACPHCGCPMSYILGEQIGEQQKVEHSVSSQPNAIAKHSASDEHPIIETPTHITKTLPELSAEEKTQLIEKIIGARVYSYNDYRTYVIEKIGGGFVTVRADNNRKQSKVGGFLGDFRFYDSHSRDVFAQVFCSEIDEQHQKDADELLKRRAREAQVLEHKKKYYVPNVSSYGENFYEEETDTGPDNVFDTYDDWHAYD